MEYQFTNDKPIYLQLMDVFKAGIISGELPEGSRLESVRDLAVVAKVNPNTLPPSPRTNRGTRDRRSYPSS